MANRFKICSTKDCEQYVGGAIGERFCCRGFWTETRIDKSPKLDANAAVMRPIECRPGMEIKNGNRKRW
jgi:hypothetical protein